MSQNLVSYKILEREPKLKVKEAAVGEGPIPVPLNKSFEAFVRKRIGSAT